MIQPEVLSDAFVAMADSLVDDFDLIDFLQDLTTRAASISGADAVGLLLREGQDRIRYAASSNDSGEFLELLQLQNEDGPCLDCITSGRPVVNVDLAGDAPWPEFAPAAAAAGFRSVHAFPLRLRSEVIGALNLFSTTGSRFSEDEVRCVQALADVATIAILQERAVAQAEAVNGQLRTALDSRIVIEQAKGALAHADGISPAEAFDLLRAAARSSQRTLVDMAHEVIEAMEHRRTTD